MKLKKKRKSKRMRGTRLHGFAAKKHKGSGNRGGKGMAGTGKRSGHRKTWILRYLHPYLGKQGFTSRKTAKKLGKVINLRDIEKNIESYAKQGLAKKTKEGTELELRNYKVLGEGELKEKLIIKAKSFSDSAKKKIEKAGGKAISERNNSEKIK